MKGTKEEVGKQIIEGLFKRFSSTEGVQLWLGNNCQLSWTSGGEKSGTGYPQRNVYIASRDQLTHDGHAKRLPYIRAYK